MKIVTDKQEVYTNTTGADQQFSIDANSDAIFEILRNKMYSKPLESMCREIVSNSRDANREAGKGKVPVEITINNRDNYIVFSDQGPGISPDRMAEVFLVYGRSTKTNTNKQTGGFGLGGKTPFALTDSFFITTRHGGTEYQYACFIDESRKGAIRLLETSPANKPDGTDIRVPLTKQQCADALTYLTNMGRFWTPPPIIHGALTRIEPYKPIAVGTNWTLPDEQTRKLYNNVICLYDGIPYFGLIDSRVKKVNHVIPVFRTGQIDVSSNRESIYWSDRTIQAFQTAYDNFNVEYEAIIKDKLDGMEDWQSKYLFMRDLSALFGSYFTAKANITYPLHVSPTLAVDTPQLKGKKFHVSRHVKQPSETSYCVQDICYGPYLTWNDNAALTLATDLKKNPSDIVVIENDMMEQIFDQHKQGWVKYDKKYDAYLVKLEQYKNGLRRSKPYPPRIIDNFYCGLTSLLVKKLNHYVRTNNKTRYYVVSADKKDLPIDRPVKLSEIDKIVLPKDNPKPKPVLSTKAPYVRMYEYSYPLVDLEVGLTSTPQKIYYFSFPTDKDLKSFISRHGIPFKKLRGKISESKARLALFTDNYLAKFQGYMKTHDKVSKGYELIPAEEWVKEYASEGLKYNEKEKSDLSTLLAYNTDKLNFLGKHTKIPLVKSMCKTLTSLQFQPTNEPGFEKYIQRFYEDMPNIKKIMEDAPKKKVDLTGYLNSHRILVERYPLLFQVFLSKENNPAVKNYIDLIETKEIANAS